MLSDVQLEKLVTDIERKVFRDNLQNPSNFRPVKNECDTQEWKENRVRTIKISKFVRNPDEEDIDNLCQLFQSFYGEDCTVSLLFHHTSQGIELYLRIADIRENVNSSGMINSLSDRAIRIFSSVYSGADVKEVPCGQDDVLHHYSHVVSVTNIAGEKNNKFISIENLFNLQDDNNYSVLLLAEPINDRRQLDNYTNELCNFLSQISEYESEQKTSGTSVTDTVNAGIFFFASAGYAHGVGENNVQTKTSSNYSVKHMTSMINKELERLDVGKSIGFWKFAAYVLSDDEQTAKSVAHQYDAVVKGKESNDISSAIIPWSSNDSDILQEYLARNCHPIFDKEYTITSNLSSLDIAHAMNFPRKSIPGFTVTECAAFGRTPVSLDEGGKQGILQIGNSYYMRHEENNSKIAIDIAELTSHIFITGSTGSGKSNTVYQLLSKIQNGTGGSHPHYLIIEPAKGEYRKVFGSNAKCYGTNPNNTLLLRINPFSFPNGTQLFSHIDRLIEIFNACWPMYAAMPAVLKDAIEQAYIAAGWNLKTSQNKYGNLYPTFIDVLEQIDVIMNSSDYSDDSKSDYKGALKTRLKSLTNGIFGQIFSFDELNNESLFDENVIIDLSEIGPETTSLIMGILVLKLHEYRMSKGSMNSELKHITVMEEAHNLLKKTPTEQSSESSNLVGKSVEMLTNAIAEMRTYGECFMIVDQAPGKLDQAVIRNTNTKIILRLPDYSDREIVGRSIGLTDSQINELGKLERGTAAVYQSGWIEAVLCKFECFEASQTSYLTDSNFVKEQQKKEIAIINGLTIPGLSTTLKGLIWKTDFPVSIKIKVINGEITKETKAAITYLLLDAKKMNSEESEESFVIDKLHEIIGNNNMDDYAVLLASFIRIARESHLENGLNIQKMTGVAK